MSKMKTFLKRLIGGIKKHMNSFWLTTGILFIPFGFYLIIEYPQYKIFGAIFAILGIILWIAAYRMIRKREKEERVERISEKMQAQVEKRENLKLLGDILKELQKLNEGKK